MGILTCRHGHLVASLEQDRQSYGNSSVSKGLARQHEDLNSVSIIHLKKKKVRSDVMHVPVWGHGDSQIPGVTSLVS